MSIANCIVNLLRRDLLNLLQTGAASGQHDFAGDPKYAHAEDGKKNADIGDLLGVIFVVKKVKIRGKQETEHRDANR